MNLYPSCTADNSFYSALEHIDEAYFFFNPAFEIEYLNPQAKKLSKRIYGQPAVAGTNILKLVSEGRRNNFKKILQQVLLGKTVQYEILVEKSETWLHCKYFPGRDESGLITGVCALLKDITASKVINRLEEKTGIIENDLFQSRLLFEQFMQNSPLVAWLTDDRGVMHYMNPMYLKTYGFTENDFGKSIYELFDSQLAIDYHMNNRQVLKSGRAVEMVEKGTKANGEEQVLKIYKFPLLVDNKLMVGGWAVDITDQVELQEKMIKSLERQEYVNEATSDAIYDWDMATGRIYHGTGFELLLGYTQREVSLKTKLSLIHPDDYGYYKQNVFNALRNQEEDKWKIQYRVKAACGHYKTIVDKAFIIRSGKSIRVIGAKQDITAQIELQQKLLSQEKQIKQKLVQSIIETQEKERRQLSVELHDNVNQILASSKLMLEVALENGSNAKMLTKKVYEGIQTVIDELRKISHDLNPSAIVDVGLAEAIEQLIENINISGKINIAFESDHYERFYGLNENDRIAIFRMVQEQLSNILKHSKAKQVLITLHLLENDTIKLCIKDDGVGFDPEKCKKGLGLRTIYNRIEYYGGTIQIKTAEGKGVEMCIALKAGLSSGSNYLKIAG